MIKEYTIINEETGEILELKHILDKKTKTKITKKMVDNMLNNANSVEDIDMDLLYSWLKLTKGVNTYGQVQLLGQYINMDYFKLSREDVLLFGYTSRLMEFINPYTNIIMKNKKTPYRNWTEIYKDLGITSKNTQTKFKKFCECYDLVRIDKTLKTKDEHKFTTRLMVNPFLVRKGVYMSQITLSRFQDRIQEGRNVNSYVIRFLQCVGILDFHK